MGAERAYNSGHRRCAAAKADVPIVLALVCRDCFVSRTRFFDWDSVLATAALTACGVRGHKDSTAPILLFNGTGASPNDVAAVETILNSNYLNYSTANSSQLNMMDESQIRKHRLLRSGWKFR